MNEPNEQQPIHNKHTSRVELGFGITLSEWATAVLAGLGSAVAAASKTIRDRFTGDIKESNDIGTKMKQQAEALTSMPKEVGQNPHDYWASLRKQKLNNARVIDELILEKRGVRSGIITGTWDRMHTLSPRSTNALIFNTVAATIIGTAATVSFFNGVASRDKIEKITDLLNAQANASKNQR